MRKKVITTSNEPVNIHGKSRRMQATPDSRHKPVTEPKPPLQEGGASSIWSSLGVLESKTRGHYHLNASIRDNLSQKNWKENTNPRIVQQTKLPNSRKGTKFALEGNSRLKKPLSQVYSNKR